MRRWLGAVLWIMAGVMFAAPGFAQIAREPYVEARLLPGADRLVPGQPVYIALEQQITPGWHTYWRNPGDSGEPTRIDWRLPEGYSAGEILWPTPKPYPLGPLTNYGYSDELVLPVAITAPATATPGETVTLEAYATWLVCSDICVPEEATLRVDMVLGAGPAQPHPIYGAKVERAVAAAPIDAGFEAGARLTPAGLELGVADAVLAGAVASDGLRNPYFFPFEAGIVDHAAAQTVVFGSSGLTLTLTPGFAVNGALDGPVTGLLAYDARIAEDRWERHAVEITAPPVEVLPTGAQPSARLGSSAAGVGLWLAMFGFAALGGLILNVMPCVFPILSMKALAMARQAHDNPGRVARHGWVFFAGVLVSFLALASVLIALKAAGEQIGRGFQLQSPPVVAGLALLMFTVGLNLLGVFEVGGRLTGAGASLAAKGGDAGAFFTGVLAVVVAAPCTAPFMGQALGFALTQSAPIGLAIFAALGAGYGAPFLILSLRPGLLRVLPKPGPWMERFKQFLAFPMFATAIWLVWVLAAQSGAAGVAGALCGMLAIGFLVWVFKNFGAGRGPGARAAQAVAALVLLAALGGLALTPDGQAPGGVKARAAVADPAKGVGEPWSPERVAELRAQGKRVFVDFTAAWCITCQVNKRVALAQDPVRAAFDDHDVVLLTADWTNRDARIAETLAAYGRSGVPLYLLYSEREEKPHVLPAVLTPGVVIEAVNALAGATETRS
ncbi:MAG: protein-disulfide reductase DsbD family protein [Maricaulaceae bacterium]